MTITLDRQKLSSNNEQERALREKETRQLAHDLIGRNEEYFAVPQNRLEFIKGQSARDYYLISRYVNAKLRGEKPYELSRRREERQGGRLPMVHTPRAADKLKAFAHGFRAIQEYLETTDDPLEKQTEGAAMATEALIIWVHPFVDGNGRTGRFMAKLIEDGAMDVDELTKETASWSHRQVDYERKVASKESTLASANDSEAMWDDEEREALRERAESLPNDIDAVYLSVKRLLEDEETRQYAKRYIETPTRYHE